VRDTDHLYKAVKRLATIKDVIEAKREVSKRDE